MPQHYQQKTKNPFRLPDIPYRRAVYAIKDYDRRKEEYAELLKYSPPILTGMPGDGELLNPTAEKGEALAAISDELHAVEGALAEIPDEYREGVFARVRHGTAYPEYAHINTWEKWKQRYIYYVAVRMGLVINMNKV